MLEVKELRKKLRSMSNMDREVFGRYDVMKLHNKYAFSFVSDYYDETNYIATVGEKLAIEWITRQ